MNTPDVIRPKEIEPKQLIALERLLNYKRKHTSASFGAVILRGAALIFDTSLLHAVATTSLGASGVRLSTTTRYEKHG